jgi:hypothetical protein
MAWHTVHRLVLTVVAPVPYCRACVAALQDLALDKALQKKIGEPCLFVLDPN